MPNQVIITQGNTDTDLYFIISGTVHIMVNGRQITTRSAGHHVGELALVDQTVRRSASVVAHDPCLLVKISETHFTTIAETHPQLWRSVAVEIGNRLRERNKHIRQPHNQPVLFIGSSSEQLEIAKAIQLGLSHDPMVATVWTDGIFKASRTTIENLMNAVVDADFALVVISPDDCVESRGAEEYGPRDNVLFELGLFMGGIGRERTLLVRPRGVDIKIPTDLLGLTPLDYAQGEESTLTPRIAPLCTEISRIVKQIGPK
jgi:predicted nucleotide-binding protein